MVFVRVSVWALTLNTICILGLANSSPLERHSQLNCTNVVIPVTITATNLHIPIATTGPVFDVPVHGTFNIAARYCEPEIKVPSKQKTLQILVHGITYDRNYWSGDGPPGSSYHGDQYSWIEFASKLGYPTLSIDRLGNGLSDHPDPVNIVQIPAQIETIHELILKARAGTLPGPATPRAFNKIVYVGHSLGSSLGNGLNVKYPEDSDATILTGFSNTLNGPFFSNSLAPTIVPAATVNPAEWGNLDPNYLALNNSTIFQQSFYYPGGYDPALLTLDYSLSGTVTLGELTSALPGPTVALRYQGPVFVVTGQHDAIFCNLPDPSPPANAPFETFGCGPYGTGLSETKALYPAAKSFQWFAPRNSGHCWHFHYEAYATFGVAHGWLALQGL
ncbi:hypothetical protein DL95DRAFT_461122 [Leptodontidium sp. 2 PMI_412]|nr:hypothetical protein DL95DRAFT_461122 [Leptodontidium sp. 2 PMI_412]